MKYNIDKLDELSDKIDVQCFGSLFDESMVGQLKEQSYRPLYWRLSEFFEERLEFSYEV